MKPAEPAGDREQNAATREADVTTREASADSRKPAVTQREELWRVADEALRAREERDQARSERERLLGQMREANQNLVLATVRANELADRADQARLEMATSEERFRSLVTATAAILFQANAKGEIAIDPESWRAFTGLELEVDDQEPGWGWLTAVHPDDRERVRQVWVQSIATRTVFTQEHRLRRRDDTYAWVMARAVPSPRQGVVREWVGMMTDISDRVRIEEAREQFIAILGHDLRNPLGAILMGCEHLRGAVHSEQDARTLARIARSALRMESMINDVLDFARGRLGGGIPIRRVACDLGSICAALVGEFRQSNPDRSISFEAAGDLRGNWDPDRLEQVLSNLVGNAIRHGRDPIVVSAHDDGDQVVLAVHNQGEPIPLTVLPTIFEAFSHRGGDDARSLGLGLYIACEIVRAHGGSITVTSTAPAGTTFQVRLPRRPARLEA